jgi:hypothetical protein
MLQKDLSEFQKIAFFAAFNLCFEANPDVAKNLPLDLNEFWNLSKNGH